MLGIVAALINLSYKKTIHVAIHRPSSKKAKQYFSWEKSLKASYCAVKRGSNLLSENNSLCNLGTIRNTVFISEITVL